MKSILISLYAVTFLANLEEGLERSASSETDIRSLQGSTPGWEPAEQAGADKRGKEATTKTESYAGRKT